MPRTFLSLCFLFLCAQITAQPKTNTAKNRHYPDSSKAIANDTVCKLWETSAEFPGGISAMKSYLIKNSKRLFEEAKKNETYGKIFVQFIVTDTGVIDSARVFRGLQNCKACDDEALKIINSMPKWKPAQVNNVNVKSRYTLPVSVPNY